MLTYARLPYVVYYILYFSTLGLFIVFINRPIVKNYTLNKREIKQMNLKKINQNEFKDKKQINKKSIISFGIFLILSILLTCRSS